jgi:hypothetical protein
MSPEERKKWREEMHHGRHGHPAHPGDGYPDMQGRPQMPG